MKKDYNIVVIDDDPQTLTCFKMWFKKYHPSINIKTCDTFNESCLDCKDNKCKNNTVDAILLDYFLSRDMIAPQLIKQIREINKDVLIIIMSNAFVEKEGDLTCINKEIMLKAINCGANRVVPKVIEDVVDVTMTHLKVREELSNSVQKYLLE
jgi:response regulator RpfG family c-di-GMP phosphodiesterase